MLVDYGSRLLPSNNASAVPHSFLFEIGDRKAPIILVLASFSLCPSVLLVFSVLKLLFGSLEERGNHRMTTTPEPASYLSPPHALLTVAYRAAKALRGASGTFRHFHIETKDPHRATQIPRAHGDLFDWALSIAQGK